VLNREKGVAEDVLTWFGVQIPSRPVLFEHDTFEIEKRQFNLRNYLRAMGFD